MKASDNPFASLLVTEGSAPASPASGKQRLFIDSADHAVKVKNSSGSVTAVGGAGGAGALILLEQHTAASSATLDFTTFISSTYDSYRLEVVDLSPANNATDLLVQMGTGGGPTWDTGNNYEMAGRLFSTSGSDVVWNAETGAGGIIFKSMSNNAGYGSGQATSTIRNLQSTAHRKSIFGTLYFVSSAPAAVFGSGGLDWITTATAVTGLRFLMSSGNIASGTIRIYGVAKS